MEAMNELEQKRDTIRSLMEYAVPADRLDDAIDLLDIYRHDRIALDLLHEFYSFLPEGRNDWVREIRLAARQQGLFLLAAVTRESGYFYLVSSEGIEFHGVVADGVWDQDLLAFFGFADRERFREQCGQPEALTVYEPMDSDPDICPACHAATGEVHELGCPVEVCPWCGGQLVYCGCRFEKLEVESLSSEKDLVRFEEILNEQGRSPYSPEQRPSFADEGPGVIID